jgi:hypothetical protein
VWRLSRFVFSTWARTPFVLSFYKKTTSYALPLTTFFPGIR